MRHLLTLVTILILASCVKNKTVETKDETDITFDEFLKTIPNQSLPLDFDCGLPNGTNSSEDFKSFKDFIPKSTDGIFGTIESNM
jgi:hypothetical protein